MFMKNFYARLLPLLVLALAWSIAQAAPAPFRIGVAPHTSARVIVETYQPLRLYLEKVLERPVEIATAPDFTEFARRAVSQDYDIAITTGHQARLLQSDAAYTPLLTYKADFKSVVVVLEQSPYRQPGDLNGTTIIGLSPTSLVTIWGQHWLLRNNIGKTTVKYVSAADSVGQLLLSNEGAAGFMSLANFQKLAPATQSRLRILAESLPLAGRVYMLNKRHQANKDKIVGALWTFAETPEGQQYFRQNKLDGYRNLEPRELVAMDPYANEVRQVLKTAKPVR